MNDDYLEYRGKCKELAEQACKEDPSLRLVRGHYWCPIWNSNEQHWWAVRPDGTIVDPSARQFPSKGLGEYEEFDGIVTCEECGRRIAGEKAIPIGRYAVCSDRCAMRLVGL